MIIGTINSFTSVQHPGPRCLVLRPTDRRRHSAAFGQDACIEHCRKFAIQAWIERVLIEASRVWSRDVNTNLTPSTNPSHPPPAGHLFAQLTQPPKTIFTALSHQHHLS